MTYQIYEIESFKKILPFKYDWTLLVTSLVLTYLANALMDLGIVHKKLELRGRFLNINNL